MFRPWEAATPGRRWLVVAFVLAILLTGYRFYQLRHYCDFFDESVEIATGWLLSEGETMYGSVFSHHMPLAAMLSQLVARISLTDHAAHFRVIPWLAYVLAAWALCRSPFEREKRGWGATSALCFLLLTALVAPLVFGQMVLNDGLWGICFTVFFLRLLLPFLLGMSLTRADAAIGAVALTLSTAGSLISFYPIVVSSFLALVTLASKERLEDAARIARSFLLGTSGTALVLILWLVAFGHLSGFVDQALLFNFNVYARYSPERSSVLKLVKATLFDWKGYLSGAGRLIARFDGEALFAPIAVLSAAWLAFLCRRRQRFVALSVLLASLIIFLRMRGDGFRALPLYVFLCGIVSLFLALLWAERRYALAVIGAAALIGPFLVAARRHESFRWNIPHRSEVIGVWARIADHIRTHTSPTERIAAFPTLPLVYLDSKRHPAVDSVYYLPWQATWESETARHPNTCEQLQAARPRFVIILPVTIWSHYPWSDYARCIDQFVKRDYVRVEPERFEGLLWERRGS